METSVQISGLKGIEDALSSAGPKLARRALRKALKAAAQPLLDAAKAKAPVLPKATPDRQPGELRDSIDVEINLSGKQASGTAKIGPTYDKAKGQDSPGVYGRFVELGSIHNPHPEPFMRTAFDGVSEQALEKFTEVLSETVKTLNK